MVKNIKFICLISIIYFGLLPAHGFSDDVKWDLRIEQPMGEGSTKPVSGKYAYDAGESAEVEAAPEEGWYLSHWLKDGENVGAETPITVSPPPADETPNIQAIFYSKWEFKTAGEFRSNPTVGADGTVYAGNDDEKLYALSKDGSKLWDFKTVGVVRSSPTLGQEDTIYVGSDDSHIYAINPGGTKKWNFRTGGTVRSSPALGDDGTVYVGSDDGRLYALDPEDGDENWTFNTDYAVRTSPVLGDNGTIYIVNKFGELYALDSGGNKKWKFEADVENDILRRSPAIDDDGIIYVGSSEGRLYAINPDGTRKWESKTGDRALSPPTVGRDSTIYVGGCEGDQNFLYAVNKNGTEKWRFATEDRIHSSATVSADGTVFVGCYGGYLYAIGPDNGSLIWKFDTGAPIKSSPAISTDGTVFIGNAGTGRTLNAIQPSFPALPTLSVDNHPTDVSEGDRILDDDGDPLNVKFTNEYGEPESGVDVTVKEFGGYDFDDGTLTRTTDADGIAEFDDLVIDEAGRYILVFFSDETAGGRSEPFNVGDTWTLSIDEPDGSGSTTPGTGDHSYSVAASALVEAVPDEGQMLAEWDENGTERHENRISVGPAGAGDTIDLEAEFVPATIENKIEYRENDVVDVPPGIYQVQDIDGIQIEDDNITLKSTHGRDHTVIEAMDEDLSNGVVIDADNVTIRGFWIVNGDHGVITRGANITVIKNRLDTLAIGILVDGADYAKIEKNIIVNCRTGIKVKVRDDNWTTETRITGNRITGNEVGITNSGPVWPIDTVATDNDIYNNDAGVEWGAEEEEHFLDAKNNWWGDESGPSPEGDGNSVSDNVDYSDWRENSFRPNQLAFYLQPSDAIAGQEIEPEITVRIEDSAGKLVTDAEDRVTLAVKDGKGKLYGATEVNAIQGVATFDNVHIERTGQNYALKASAGELDYDISDNFNIERCDAAQLGFERQPSDTIAGEDIDPPVTVRVLDSYGNLVEDADNTISLTVEDGDGVLEGVTEVDAVEGVASFDELHIELAGEGYTLKASSPLLNEAVSESFDIRHADADQLEFGRQPSDTIAGENIDPPVTVRVLDSYGNPVDDADNTISLTVEDGDGVLEGASAVDAVAGIVSFSDVYITHAGVGYTLEAMAYGLDSDFSYAFDVLSIIQHEIDLAIEDPEVDLVEIKPGDYVSSEPIVIGPDAGGFTLRAEGNRENTFIDAGGGPTALVIEANQVRLEGFTVQNFAEKGIEIKGDNAYIIDNVIDAHNEPAPENTGILISGPALNVRIRGNRIIDAEVGIGFNGSAEGTRISSNTIKGYNDNDAGIKLIDGNPADTRAAHNNIHRGDIDKEIEWSAVKWIVDDSTYSLQATYNWWGDETGPYNETENPDGEGDKFTGKVEFEPWVGAETAEGGAFARAGESSEETRLGLGLETDGGEVFATRLAGDTNIAGDSFAHEASSYTLLLIENKEEINEVTFEIAYAEPSGKVAYWLDEPNGKWTKCSHQNVIESDRYPDYDGYIEIKISDDTVPSLGDFSEVIFAIETADPDDDDDDEWYDCFVGTAAYGTPMAEELDVLRAFRDQKLLSDEAGRRAVESYYRISPPVAELIGRSDTARSMVREVLKPVVSAVRRSDEVD